MYGFVEELIGNLFVYVRQDNKGTIPKRKCIRTKLIARWIAAIYQLSDISQWAILWKRVNFYSKWRINGDKSRNKVQSNHRLCTGTENHCCIRCMSIVRAVLSKDNRILRAYMWVPWPAFGSCLILTLKWKLSRFLWFCITWREGAIPPQQGIADNSTEAESVNSLLWHSDYFRDSVGHILLVTIGLSHMGSTQIIYDSVR